MKLQHIYSLGVGIAILFGVGWTIYLRAQSARTIEQVINGQKSKSPIEEIINDSTIEQSINGRGPKLSVFVNYAYSTSEDLKERAFKLKNLEFFLRHGVTFSETANITYGITVSGGDFPATFVTQRHSEEASQFGLPQIFLLHRENEGFDFGAHAAMLDAQCTHMGLMPKCDLPYDAFIFFNDGVRGPFLPSYMPNDFHWSQAFLDKLTALQHPNTAKDYISRNVALVGTSIVCLPKGDEAVKLDPSFFGPKVEGFAFAVTGDALAHVRKEATVFSSHRDERSAIISGEYNLTRTVLLAPQGWRVTSLLKQHERLDFKDQRTWDCNRNTHPSRAASYGSGGDIAPLEVIFHKARWTGGGRVSEDIMMLYSDWQDQIGVSEFSTKDVLWNQMANEASPMAKSVASTLVSYVYGGDTRLSVGSEKPVWTQRPLRPRSRRKIMERRIVDICDDNLDVFMKRGYSHNKDVDFVFTMSHGWQAPRKLEKLAHVVNNIFIRDSPLDCGDDLCQHQSVVDTRRGMKNYSEYIFLNCGARGPYGQQKNWYRQFRKILEAYDAVGPTISAEFEYHLQSYMIAVSSRSIHIVDTLWQNKTLSEELVLKRLHQFNISVKHLEAVGRFLKIDSSNKHLRIALGELGLSFVLLSNGKKLHATCFDARTVVDPGESQGRNPTCCFKSEVAAECLHPTVAYVSSADCLACPQLEPNRCIFVKFGGDAAWHDLRSPWTFARVSEYDLQDLGYRIL